MPSLYQRLMVAHQMATRSNPELRLTDARAANAMLAVVIDHLHRHLINTPDAWKEVRAALSIDESADL